MTKDNDKIKGLYVDIRKGDGSIELDKALQKLKRMIKDDNLMVKLQEKSYYIKPSEKKRERKNKAKARQRAINRENNR